MNANGAAQTRLTTDPAGDFDPVWNADGTKIAFVAARDGNFEIYTMNPDGTGQTRLTSNSAHDADPAWSPDGTQIAFASNRDGNFEIYKMNSDGTAVTRLTNSGSGEGFPAWSPDGTKIAYNSTAAGFNDIWKMNPDGSGQVQLTTDPGEDIHPSWSPDGKEIGFASNRVGLPSRHDIWKMNADGSGQVSVISFPSDEDFPAAAPGGGGNGVAQSDNDGDYEIYTLNPNVPLTSNGASDTAPDWQPVTGSYPRPAGATPYSVPLVPALNSCVTPNTTHAAPITKPSCAPAVGSSAFLTVGTPDLNGQPAKSSGLVKVRVFCDGGAPGEVPPCPTTTGDQLDGAVTVSLTDVRCAGSGVGCSGPLADYTGDLLLEINAEISDRSNGGANGAATTQSYPARGTVPCTATGDPTVGSTCSLSSTLDAMIGAGAVVEKKRAVWELGETKVLDAGADGVATTLGDNTTFAVSGLFFP